MYMINTLLALTYLPPLSNNFQIQGIFIQMILKEFMFPLDLRLHLTGLQCPYLIYIEEIFY